MFTFVYISTRSYINTCHVSWLYYLTKICRCWRLAASFIICLKLSPPRDAHDLPRRSHLNQIYKDDNLLSMRGHQTFKDDGTWDFNCYWKKSGQILTQSCTCCDIGDFYAQMIPRTNKCLTWKKIGHAFCTSQLSSLLFFVISSVYLIWLSWCLSRGGRRNGWKIHI